MNILAKVFIKYALLESFFIPNLNFILLYLQSGH